MLTGTLSSEVQALYMYMVIVEHEVLVSTFTFRRLICVFQHNMSILRSRIHS
jgi:hypothetical protein